MLIVLRVVLSLIMALCWGRGVFRSRSVRLGGSQGSEELGKILLTSQQGSEVSLYHDVSTAPFA